MRRTMLLLGALGLALLLPGAEQYGLATLQPKPNIVFIGMDDMRYDDLQFMPKTTRSIGVARFTKAYATDSLCCPSRATWLTGQYPWNHGIKGNTTADGSRSVWMADTEDDATDGVEGSSLPVWLNNAGYYTYAEGKYFNFHQTNPWPTTPFDEQYFNNGRDGTLMDRATMFVRSYDFSGAPLFMYLAVHTPHEPAHWRPEQYASMYPRERVPRTVAFNEECPSKTMSDKPAWLKDKRCLGRDAIADMDDLYRKRAQSLRWVDDLIDSFLNELKARGQLGNTYIVFTSDNGFHMGEHRLRPLKDTPYEPDVHIPLLVRGPGITGVTSRRLVANNDIAPTIAQMAGARPLRKVDGRSFLSLAQGASTTNGRRRLGIMKLDGPRGPDVAPLYKGMIFETARKYIRYHGDAVEQFEYYKNELYEVNNKYKTISQERRNLYEAQLNNIVGCKGAALTDPNSCYQAENLGN